jgi:hypothetical protein
MPVTGRHALALRPRFHNHAPQQLAIGLVFDHQAANELGGILPGGAGEEELGQSWEALGGGGGYESGWRSLGGSEPHTPNGCQSQHLVMRKWKQAIKNQ